jgi:hypothetical protein
LKTEISAAVLSPSQISEKVKFEVAGIFSRGFNDMHAKYGLQIFLFDLTEGLNIQPNSYSNPQISPGCDK